MAGGDGRRPVKGGGRAGVEIAVAAARASAGRGVRDAQPSRPAFRRGSIDHFINGRLEDVRPSPLACRRTRDRQLGFSESRREMGWDGMAGCSVWVVSSSCSDSEYVLGAANDLGIDDVLACHLKQHAELNRPSEQSNPMCRAS